MIIFDTDGNILDVNDRMLEMYDVDPFPGPEDESGRSLLLHRGQRNHR